MKFILLIITMLISHFSYTQIKGRYSIETSSSLDCYLNLSDNGKYSMMVDFSLSDDMMLSMLISNGDYHIFNKEIILVDEIHQCKMILTQKNDRNLYVTCAFDFLKGKQFAPHWNDIAQETSNYKINKPFFTQERFFYNLFYKETITLNQGSYSERAYGSGFMLTTLSDATYAYEYIYEYQYPFYRSFIISKGTWSRNGNELELYDTSLNHSFYALIGNNKIISKLLPCDYTGITLYYQKTDPKATKVP